MRKITHEEFLERVRLRYGSEYTVLGIYDAAHSPILLRHNTCRTEWGTTSPYDFLKPHPNRCPACSHPSRRRSADHFKSAVAALEGDRYTVIGEYTTNKTHLMMRHESCGHEYSVKPNLFLGGRRCPRCRELPSRGVQKIKSFLRSYEVRFETEKYLPGMRLEGDLRVDVYLQDYGVAIEFDGEHHFQPKRGGEAEFALTQLRDEAKNRYCAERGIPLVRIPYWDAKRIDLILKNQLSRLGVISADRV